MRGAMRAVATTHLAQFATPTAAAATAASRSEIFMIRAIFTLVCRCALMLFGVDVSLITSALGESAGAAPSPSNRGVLAGAGSSAMTPIARQHRAHATAAKPATAAAPVAAPPTAAARASGGSGTNMATSTRARAARSSSASGVARPGAGV